MIPENRADRTGEIAILFRILTRREWERLQEWRESCPGSSVEHLEAGLYLLTVPAGVSREAA